MSPPHAQAFAAIEATPLADRLLPPSPYQAITRSALRFPERPALTFLSSGEAGAPALTLSYQQLSGALQQTANALRALGVGPDDAVTVMLPNLIEYHLVFWGGQAAGVANPVNPLLDVEHLAGLMRSAQSKVLVTLAPGTEVGLWEKALALVSEVPSLQHIIAVDPFRSQRPSPALPVTPTPASYLHELLSAQPSTLTFEPSGDPQKVAALFHTGGTTGQPKLARHTHQNEVFDAWTCSAPVDMNETDVVLCGLPLFHVNGLIVTGLAPFMHGAHVVLATAAGYRDPSVLLNFWELVETHRLTSFSGVPSIYATLHRLPTAGHDLSSLKFALCGAAPMPPALIQAFEEKTGLRLLEGYGLTEGTCVSALNPPQGERKAGSIGVPLPYHQVRVALLDPDGRFKRDAATGEVGLLLIQGLNVIPGYVEDRHNAGLWVDAEGSRWLNTGDLARLDEDGYLFLAGRKKELIIRNGHNIDPLVIEEALLHHPEVALAAAVGRPDTYAGELPVAYVQLQPGATVTEQELLDFASGHIAERPALPKAVRIVPTLPMTGVGKTFKPQLVWQEVQDELGLALQQAGLQATVQVGPDARQGLLATVTTPSVDQARGVLEAYAVPFTLEAST